VAGERGSAPDAAVWGVKYDAEVAEDVECGVGAVGVEGFEARRDRWDAETVELADGRRNRVGVSGAVFVRWCLDDGGDSFTTRTSLGSFDSLPSLRLEDGGSRCCDASLEPFLEWRRPNIGMAYVETCAGTDTNQAGFSAGMSCKVANARHAATRPAIARRVVLSLACC
jgi:hypothetical protein